jgi:uncharacterized protein YcgI (DUF1989 family)
MKEKVISDFSVPAGEGKAFVVSKGQIVSFIEIEGKQMADIVFLNAHDYKESFHAGWSAALNMMLGEGDMKKISKLYSKPPRDNVMLTVVDDATGVHLAWNGGRCSRKVYEQFFNMPGHRNCQDNLAAALAPYGLDEDDVPDVFNAFMNAEGFAEGRFDTLEPVTEKGDYISMRAEMDVLVGVSACPFDLISAPLPLGIKIVEHEE